MKTLHRYSLTIVLCLIALTLPVSAYATLTPFGGRVSNIQFCDNGGWLVTVIQTWGPGITQYMITTGTKLYSFGLPTPSQYVLGASNVLLPCYDAKGHSLGAGYTMEMLGTAGISHIPLFPIHW